MKIKRVGKTQATAIEMEGGTVLFSYNVPVAIMKGCDMLITEEKYSVTTSKHINTFIRNNPYCRPAIKMPQKYFDNAVICFVK